MKKNFIWIAFAALAVVALIGCPTPNNGPDPEPDGGELQSGAALEWVAVGTIKAFPDASAASEADVLAAGFESSELELSESQKAQPITYGLADSSNKASVEVAKVTGAAAPAFSATLTGNTFADGDKLFVKVTSEDKTKVLYYGFDVTLGRNAKLASVTIGATPHGESAFLGSPAATLAGITYGTFQIETNPQSFKALPEDDQAAVSYAFVELSAAPTALPTTWESLSAAGKTFAEVFGSVTDSENEFNYVFIKVVSTSGQVTLHYGLKLVFPREGRITYGTPALVDPANPGSAFYIDPMWDDIDWDYMIDRGNIAEGTDSFTDNPHTKGKAKAMWDDDGIWVLVDVDILNSRKVVTSGQAHEADSLEIFVNERRQLITDYFYNDELLSATTSEKTGDIGNQYRFGANGARSGEIGVSVTYPDGNDGTETDQRDNVTVNGATYSKFRTALKKSTGSGIGTGIAGGFAGDMSETSGGGYVIVAHVPWKFKDRPSTSEVFNTDGTVKDLAKIGFELQLNCNDGEGTRDGILTWNGISTQAYQHAESFATVTLRRDGKTPQEVEFSTISSQQLSDETRGTGKTLKQLDVQATDGLQWFVSDSAFGPGEAIENETSDGYTPDNSTIGIKYYYAVVNPGEPGAIVTNRRAKIELIDPADDVEKWTIPGKFIHLATKGTGLAVDATAKNKVVISSIGSGDPRISYKFPVGKFSKVELTLKVSNRLANGTAEMQVKDGWLVTTPDAKGGEGSVYKGNDDPWVEAYVIGTDSTSSLTSGAISWQVKTWQSYATTFDFEIVQAVFTVISETDGSFYVNIADVDERNGDGTFGDFAKGSAAIDYVYTPADEGDPDDPDDDVAASETGDGTSMVKLTFTTLGDSSSRARAVINLPTSVTEVLGTYKQAQAPQYKVEITGVIGAGSPAYFLGYNATEGTDWNTWNLAGGTVTMTPSTTDLFNINNQDSAGQREGVRDAKVLILRVGNKDGTDNITIKSIKFIPTP